MKINPIPIGDARILKHLGQGCPQPCHEARGQLVVVVEGAPLVHPSAEDAFVDAQALTPSIDEGVEPKIKIAPRRASPTRFLVDSSRSSSTPTSYWLQLLQGQMEGLIILILVQQGFHFTPKKIITYRFFLLLLFLGQQYRARGWGPYFYNPQEKNMTSWGTNKNTNRWGFRSRDVRSFVEDEVIPVT